MKKLSSEEIRNKWINFFKEKGHAVEPGASLIPKNDPSLLWINSGVAALKKYFDGSKIPPSKRIVNVQKCIRTNDISNVGKTARHHTFFEMLGNFSIGDYFRKEIIEWAFEILTSKKYFGLDKNKLYITYHPSDLETKALWIKQGVLENHLISLKENFWEIGEGPCGPNTEVFYDRGEKYDKEKKGVELLKKDLENDRYIEIWGIVFSQYNAESGVAREKYKELPHKNIDTGAGLERIACILQETETNFETDLFSPYIEKLKKICKKPYKDKYLTPYRVIVDHIRACTFALADGENFSNEGRGYVLRRLLRRAIRYGQKLDLYEPFIYKLVSAVADNMKCFYSCLKDQNIVTEISNKIKNEEEQFLKTLNNGEKILNKILRNSKVLSGEDAFKLYDTFGFPLDLTLEICEEHNVKVDVEGFNKLLNKQKELAKSSRKNLESFNKQSQDLLNFTTESEFIYDKGELNNIKVIALFKDGKNVKEIKNEGEVVFDKTNFYSEMGGEVSDIGYIENSKVKAKVLDVLKAPHGQHLHKVKIEKGTSIKVGALFNLHLDYIRRHQIECNHSATHLLQSALIEVLGNTIRQKGSYVDDKLLRFDFSYDHKVSLEDLNKIEHLVNEYILQSISSYIRYLPIEEANKLNAISEFNEKYGDIVRVVSFGDVSSEFCGGCHVKNTNEIGVFVIESESAIASGVRRIVAYTGVNAYRHYKNEQNELLKIRNVLEAKSNGEILTRINALLLEKNKLEKDNETYNRKIALYQSQAIIDEIKKEKISVNFMKNTANSTLISIFDEINSKFDDFILVLVGEEKDKYPLVVGVGDKTLKRGINAKNIIIEVTSIIGGKGGGKDNLCKGVALDPSKMSSLKLKL